VKRAWRGKVLLALFEMPPNTYGNNHHGSGNGEQGALRGEEQHLIQWRPAATAVTIKRGGDREE